MGDYSEEYHLISAMERDSKASRSLRQEALDFSQGRNAVLLANR